MSLNPDDIARELCVISNTLDHPDIIPSLPLMPEHFCHTTYREAWRVMLEMSESSQMVEVFAVAAAIRGNDKGTISALDLTLGEVRAAMYIPQLADGVIEAHRMRSVALLCSRVLGQVKGGQGATEALDVLSEGMLDIDRGSSITAIKVGALVREVMTSVMDGTPKGIPSGIEVLDEMLGGFPRGVVTVCAGRPAMGKSAFAMALVDGASGAGHGAHVFSLEDTRSAYGHRVMARMSGVSVNKFRTAQFTRGDMDLLSTRGGHIRTREGWLISDGADQLAGYTAEEIVRAARAHAKDNNTSIVLIDYLQLVTMTHRGPRHEQLGQAMQVFANAAKCDDMAYVVLSQVNRGCESRDDKRPMMSDLKESGDVEDKAKLILFLYRGNYYNQASDPTEVEIIIAKNNQGATGVAKAKWHGPTCRLY